MLPLDPAFRPGSGGGYTSAVGLLAKPARTEDRFRLYFELDIQHLRFIRRTQELGFSLWEVWELLIQNEHVEPYPYVRDLIEQKLTAVRANLEHQR